MSALRQALADYLTMRRALGYKLDKTERLLGQFITFAEGRGEDASDDRNGAGLGNAACRRRTRSGLPGDWPRFVSSPGTSTRSTLPPRCRQRISCRVERAGQHRICTRHRKSRT